ncbi:MAG: ATP-binding protein [Thermodesulfobacteriota bacterium]
MLFGMDRELAINKSGVRKIFTPHTPIQSIDLFFGRQSEIQRIIEHLNTPGQHSLLFGERGVGKSSLANVACELLLKHLVKGKFFKKRCDSGDTFPSIVATLLCEIGIDIYVSQSEKMKCEGGKAGLSIPLASASVDTQTTNKTINQGFLDRANSPSWVAEQLKNLDGLFLLDEIDALSNSEDKKKIAELVKLLSDENSPLKILIVGIAESSSDLTAGHPSVQRCLRETRLGRMSPEELSQIIVEGQKKLKINFSSTAIKRIVSVSSGYPHFTHLLALKSAEDAISDKKKDINVADVEKSTRRAVEDAEGSLKRAYDEAVRSFTTDTYKKILLAASICKEEEIRSNELRKAFQSLWGAQITQGSLSNYLKRLVAEDSSAILRRIAKGVYRFSDPRMPSYIRIAQAHLIEIAEPDA